MADSTTDMYIPPSILDDDRPWLEPLRDNLRSGDERMSMPIVVTLLLSIILFVLFMWFFLSPLFFRRSGEYTAPRPLDLEDAYFVDENVSRSFPYTRTSDTERASMRKTPTQRYPFPPLRSVVSPPPAYSSRPNSPIGGTLPFFNNMLARGTSSSSHPKKQTSLRSLFSVAKLLRRSVSAPIQISKPIPLPEFPLPGPDVLIESDVESDTKNSESNMTIIRPCIAPHSVSESTTLHSSSTHLLSPSRAVVHHKESPFRSTAQRHSDFFPSSSFPASLGQHSTTIDLDVSVSSSKIGLAF